MNGTWYFIVPVADLREDLVKATAAKSATSVRRTRDAQTCILKWTGPGEKIPSRFSPYIPLNQDQILERLRDTAWKQDEDLTLWDQVKLFFKE